jgi:hypothetical protein
LHRPGAASKTDIDERDIHHCMNTSWMFGGADMARWIDFKTGDADGFKSFMVRGREACGGLLVAGRHISCDPSSHSFLREIPQCWMTGQPPAPPRLWPPVDVARRATCRSRCCRRNCAGRAYG